MSRANTGCRGSPLNFLLELLPAALEGAVDRREEERPPPPPPESPPGLTVFFLLLPPPPRRARRMELEEAERVGVLLKLKWEICSLFLWRRSESAIRRSARCHGEYG